MKRIHPKIFLDYDAKGFHNPPNAMRWKRKKIILACGGSDDVSIFTEKGDVYVLSTNSRYGYAGLEHFSVDSQDAGVVGNCFFQDVCQELEIKDFFDKSDCWQRRVLMQYI